MKKLIALFCVCVCLCLTQTSISLSNLSKNFFGTFTFFSSQKVEDKNVDVTQNGNGFLICCDTTYASTLLTKMDKSKIAGESFCFDGNKKDVRSLLKQLNAKIVKEENTSNLYIIYAYSPKLLNFVWVENQKVNIQIAQSKNLITVGTPLILGGF